MTMLEKMDKPGVPAALKALAIDISTVGDR